MVPGEGFEPPTFGLQNRCTTTVLTRHTDARVLSNRNRASAPRPILMAGQAEMVWHNPLDPAEGQDHVT
jgi:hypothetical protein